MTSLVYFSADPGSGGPTTAITLDTFTNVASGANRLFPAVNPVSLRQGDVPFRGTYTGGAPTGGVQVKIMRHGGALVQDWTTITGLTASSNVWQGKLLVPTNSPRGTPYYAEVRVLATPAVTVVGTDRFFVGHLTDCSGQSHMEQVCGVGIAIADSADGTCWYSRESNMWEKPAGVYPRRIIADYLNTLSTLLDMPCGGFCWAVAAKSAMDLSKAGTYLIGTQTVDAMFQAGVAQALITGAPNVRIVFQGEAEVASVPGGNAEPYWPDNWDNGIHIPFSTALGQNPDDIKTLFYGIGPGGFANGPDGFVLGGTVDPECGVQRLLRRWWMQMRVGDHKPHLKFMASGFDASYARSMPGFTVSWVAGHAYTGNSVAGDVIDHTDGYAYQCTVPHTSTTFAADLAAGKWRANTDWLHQDGPSRIRFTKRAAYGVAYEHGAIANPPRFRIVSAQAINATTTDVTVSHGLGTDFTPASGNVPNFRVSGNNWATNSVCTGVRVNATTIRLTHPDVGTTIKLRHGFYWLQDGVDYCRDNSPATVALDVSLDEDIAVIPVTGVRLPQPCWIDNVFMGRSAYDGDAAGIHTAVGPIYIGEPHSDRWLILQFANDGNYMISAVATKAGHANISFTVVTGSNALSAGGIAVGAVPASWGRFADGFNIRLNGAMSNPPAYSLWTVRGNEADMSVLVDADGQHASTGTTITTNINTAAGGFITAVGRAYLNSGFSPKGLSGTATFRTNYTDANIPTGGSFEEAVDPTYMGYTFGGAVGTAANTTNSSAVTASWSGTSGGSPVGVAAASFGPGVSPSTSAHNGGTTQAHIGGAARGTAPPFINILKTMNEWSYNSAPVDPTQPPVPMSRTTDGYPISFPAQVADAGVQSIFNTETSATYSGDYVLKWDGTGEVSLFPGWGLGTLVGSTGYNSSTGGYTSTGAGHVDNVPRTDTTGSNTAFFIAVTNSSDPIRNIRLYKKSNETLFDAGGVWEPDYVNKMIEAGPGALRTLGSIGSASNGTNDANFGLWADRKTRGHYSYAASEFRTAYWAGTTVSNSGYDFVLNKSGFALTDKAILHCMFHVPVQGPVGFGLPSTIAAVLTAGTPAVLDFGLAHGMAVGNAVYFGAYTSDGLTPIVFPTGFGPGIYYYVASVVDANKVTLKPTRTGTAINASTSVSNFSAACVLSINTNGTGYVPAVPYGWHSPGRGISSGPLITGVVATMTYDQTCGSWYVVGADNYYQVNQSIGILNGIPPEDLLELCVLVGAHPWWVSPFLAMEKGSDPHLPADFITNLMQYCKDNGPSWMVPVFEPPNETWSFHLFVFFSVMYASAVAWKRLNNPNADVHHVYGKWTTNLGKAAALTWPLVPTTTGDRSKYSVISSIQTAYAHVPSELPVLDPRLTCPDYVAIGGEAAYKWADFICGTTYYGPQSYYQKEALMYGYDWTVTYKGNPTAKLTVADLFISTALNTAPDVQFTLPYVNTCFVNMRTWATGHSTFSAVPTTGNTIHGAVAYEGGYSAEYHAGHWATAIVSATAANPCVLTLAADSRFNVDAVGFPPTTVTGIPAMVGMGMIPSGVSGMTQLNITKTTGGLTFGVGGSANIGGANTYVVGDWIAFTATSNLDIPTTNYMPPEVVVGKAYCVVSAGDPFQISLVAGGSPITFAAPDTQARIISEQCFKVLAVNADGANTVRIEFNASGLTPGSGGDGKYAASRFLANNLAYGAKSCNNLGIATTQMFQNMYDLHQSSPYFFIGKWASHLVYFGSGSTWNVLDPDMNAPITPQWQAIIDWNYP